MSQNKGFNRKTFPKAVEDFVLVKDLKITEDLIYEHIERPLKEPEKEVVKRLYDYMKYEEILEYLCFKNSNCSKNDLSRYLRPYFNDTSLNTEFTQEEFLRIADDLIYEYTGRPLKKGEKEILKGFWTGMRYKALAEYLKFKHLYYTEDYLLKDLRPKLMKKFSEALRETVKKNNFKGAFERKLKSKTQANYTQDRTLPTAVNRLIDFLHDTVKDNQNCCQDIINANCSLDYIPKDKDLNDLEIEGLRGSWNKETYVEMTITPIFASLETIFCFLRNVGQYVFVSERKAPLSTRGDT